MTEREKQEGRAASGGPTATADAALAAAADQIRAWQTRHGFSDSQMLRDFRGLGSTKTYTRILDRDLADLDTERWARDYQAVWNLIQLLGESEAEDNEVYADLTTVSDLRQAVADAMRERGNNRLVIVQGPSGSGKTTAARLLAGRYGARVVMAEATEIWKDNANVMLGAILRALGVENPPDSAAGKWDAAIARLCASRVCLVIDEAHHLGPRTLNLVKSILNQAPGEVVLLAMGTLWARLESQAYAEARQLTLNRLGERLRFEGPELVDVEKILERRLGLDGEAKAAAQALAAASRDRGALAFVRLVCRRARRLAGKGKVSLELVERAMAQVGATR